MKVDQLKLDPKNARKRGKNADKVLAGSLAEFGAARSVVMDADGIIRAGNGTVEAAKAAGITKAKIVKGKPDELVVVQRSDLKGQAAVAYAIADNRTSELAEWDVELLGDHLDGLTEFDAEGLGFTDDDLAELFPSDEPELDDIPPELDRADELQSEWNTASGQLWKIGEHRLLCGDSTSESDVQRLTDGEAMDLLFTSPPYAQQRDYTEESDCSDWDKLMRGVFSIIPMSNGGQVLVNLGLIHRENEWVPYWDGWIEWMRGEGWRRFGWYVWDQGFGLPGNWNGRFGPSHEWLFHFNKESVQPKKWVDKQPENIKPRNAMESTMRGADGQTKAFTNPGASAQPTKVPDSVIRIGRQVGSDGHVAQFPVAFAAAVLLSWPGHVYDPFLGSGTTMLAAEQLNRKCFGMEISPKYCAVILQRMKDAGCSCELMEGD